MNKSFYRSQIKRVQLLRLLLYLSNAKVQLLLAREARDPTPYLKAVERSVALLEHEKQRIARSIAMLFRAAIANRKNDRANARNMLELASSELAACEMGLWAASARRCLGQLIGGDLGKAVIAEADRWMTAQGIRNPSRMTAVYAPGFDDSLLQGRDRGTGSGVA